MYSMQTMYAFTILFTLATYSTVVQSQTTQAAAPTTSTAQLLPNITITSNVTTVGNITTTNNTDSNTMTGYSTTTTTVVDSTGTSVPVYSSITPSYIPANTDLSECTCDRTGNKCDINCCCDPDCTVDHRVTFTQCVDDISPGESRYCTYTRMVFQDNMAQSVSVTNPNIFCIWMDQNLPRNYYIIPDLITTLDQFEKYAKGKYSYQASAVPYSPAASTYTIGEALLTTTGSTFGMLPLPMPLASSAACVDLNPARFLHDESYVCNRSPGKTLASFCGVSILVTTRFNTELLIFALISRLTRWCLENPLAGTHWTCSYTSLYIEKMFNKNIEIGYQSAVLLIRSHYISIWPIWAVVIRVTDIRFVEKDHSLSPQLMQICLPLRMGNTTLKVRLPPTVS